MDFIYTLREKTFYDLSNIKREVSVHPAFRAYLNQAHLPSSQKQAPGNLIWSPNETIKVSQLRGVNPIYVVENLEIKTLNMKENSKSSI